MPLFLNDIVLLTIKGRCFSQRILFTQTYRVAVTGGPGESANLQLGYLSAAWDHALVGGIFGKYALCLSTDYQSLETRTQVIAPVRLAYRSDVNVGLGMFGAGTVANDSAALTMRTEAAGRKEVATKHIGPIPDGASGNGVLELDYRANLVAFGSALRSDITDAGTGVSFKPVIYHPGAGDWSDITSFVIGEQSRVQRRRTVGLGE